MKCRTCYEEAQAVGLPNKDLCEYQEKYLGQIIDSLDDSYDLIYIDYRDELDDEQVQMLVEGDEAAFWDSTEGWRSESQWDGADYVWETHTFPDPETCEKCGEYLAEPEDFKDEIKCAIMERDSGSWVDELICRTSYKWFLAIPTGGDTYAIDHSRYYPSDAEEAYQVAREQLDEVGVEYTDEMIQELVQFADYCMLPMFAFEASVSELTNSEEDTITISESVLWLGNTWEGTGWAVKYDKPMTFKKSEVHLDSMIKYGYQSVFGV